VPQPAPHQSTGNGSERALTVNVLVALLATSLIAVMVTLLAAVMDVLLPYDSNRDPDIDGSPRVVGSEHRKLEAFGQGEGRTVSKRQPIRTGGAAQASN